jgi:hypothetical protein
MISDPTRIVSVFGDATVAMLTPPSWKGTVREIVEFESSRSDDNADSVRL